MSTVLTENIVLSRTRQHDLSRVRKLNCWGSELSDVSIVERMPHVEVLSLTINNITTLRDFGACKNLQELYLRKNKIADINELYYIQELPNLKKLTLNENPCAEHPNYRYTVLRALPYLELLDNVPVTSEGEWRNLFILVPFFFFFFSIIHYSNHPPASFAFFFFMGPFNRLTSSSRLFFSKPQLFGEKISFFSCSKDSQPDHQGSSGLKNDWRGKKSLNGSLNFVSYILFCWSVRFQLIRK